MADVDEDAARDIARRFKVSWHTDYRVMLDREKLDLISIAVPSCLHRQVALDVVDRGIHLLVEKPTAGTAEEAQEIIDRATERGVTTTGEERITLESGSSSNSWTALR